MMWLLTPMFSTAVGAEPWWSPDWSMRARLRIDNTPSTEDLVDFPLLVLLEEGVHIAHAQAAPGGADLRFVDPVTGDDLPYEIERWNVDGRSSVWVRVPNLRRGSDSEILWMYSGNPSASPQSSGPDTWADYLGVWHLSEPDGTRDATTNNATNSLGTPGVADGRVGVGRSLDQPGDGYVVRDGTGLNVDDAITVSAWVRVTDWRVEDATLVIRPEGWALQRCGQTNGPAWVISVEDDGDVEREELCGAPLTNDAWHQVVGVYDPEEESAALFVDGEEIARREVEDKLVQEAYTAVAIGTPESAQNNPFGVLDEVRIIDVARSPDWIRADWRSVTDDLVTWCALEHADPHAADPCGPADLVPGGEGGVDTTPEGPAEDRPGDPRGPGSEAEAGQGAVPGCGCAFGARPATLIGGSLLLLGLVRYRRRREVTSPG